MPDTKISQNEIAGYSEYVGRTREHTDTVERGAITRLAATLNTEEPTEFLPPLWHYSLFLTSIWTSSLGEDGHPHRGDFLPPVALPRRMFAGAALTFHQPVRIGAAIERTSRISSVEHRRGKTGDLVFVHIEMAFRQVGSLCITEKQTIVYRGQGRTTTLPVAAGTVRRNDRRGDIWRPTAVELFRYSASTFNAHRIHYDERYAKEIEGYPGLIVHGPLIATRLCHFVADKIGRAPAEFSFRAEAPAFAGSPLRLSSSKNGQLHRVTAERADGTVAMSATATE